MKYKRERRSKPKSKSKLNRKKLEKYLRQEGISLKDAVNVLDSKLASRANGRKYRDSRRSDSENHYHNSSGSRKSHDRQSNGRKHTKGRIAKKRKKKSIEKCRDSPDHHIPHTSKMYNGHRHSSSSSSSLSPSPAPSDGKKETQVWKVIKARLEDFDKSSNPSSSSKSGRSREAKRQSNDRPKEERLSRKLLKTLADSFPQFLLDNRSRDGSNDSDTPRTTDVNDSESSDIERPDGRESPPIIILSDSDEKNANESVHTNENSVPTTRTISATTSSTRITPTRISSPALTENDHRIRVSNIKTEKKHNRSSKVYRKNHQASHQDLPNQRETSPSSCDDDPLSTEESDSSGESPHNRTPNNSYTKTKRRKKITKEERMRVRKNAHTFKVEKLEPQPQRWNAAATKPVERESYVSSPKQNSNPSLSVISYSQLDDEVWSNVTDDSFSNFSGDDVKVVERHEVQVEVEQEIEEEEEQDSNSLHEDFNAADDDVFVHHGEARQDFDDYDGLTIDFEDRPQIIEISMAAPHNDDPHQLVVESEETVECADPQNENSNIYRNRCDDTEDTQDTDSGSAIGNKFPIKIFESTPDASNPLTIVDIMMRMSQQEIDTSVELSKIIEDNDDDAVVATTTKGIEQDGSMITEEMSEPSGVTTDDESLVRNRNDVQQQPFNTTSQFLNASNGRQVLVLLKTKIYFHGSLSIRLIAGSASIFGYELMQGETVSAYSPRSDCCLHMSPSAANDHYENNVDISLNDIPSAFDTAELETLVDDFDSRSDAIVLLENDSSNRSYNMIESYMRDTIFTDFESTGDRRPHRHHNHHQLSETMLRCRFFSHTHAGLRVNPQWQDVNMTINSRHMIIGGKGVGKSTLLRYLINKNLQKFSKILLIDLDIGLPEMFVPQTVSATIITEPILGPGYIRNTPPYKAYLFGDVNVLVSPIKYLKCVLKLLKYCNCREDLQSMPWVINTMGYSPGFGLELIAAILRALNPTDLIQIQSPKSANNVATVLNADVVNAFGFNIFRNEVQYMRSECTYSTYVCNTMSSERQQDDWNRSQRDLRYAMIISKFGSILQGNVNWITDVRPLWTCLDQIRILILSGDCDNVQSQLNVLNGNMVYLCQSSESSESSVADEDIVDCYGIGIVRSVEAVNSKIYLLPAISKTEIEHVNVIAICNIPLPPALLLNQSSRINGRIPYVCFGDNFAGAKKNVPNSCRPENKRMSNNHIKLD